MIQLPVPVRDMLASRPHRLRHHLWHSVRNGCHAIRNFYHDLLAT